MIQLLDVDVDDFEGKNDQLDEYFNDKSESGFCVDLEFKFEIKQLLDNVDDFKDKNDQFDEYLNDKSESGFSVDLEFRFEIIQLLDNVGVEFNDIFDSILKENVFENSFEYINGDSESV